MANRASTGNKSSGDEHSGLEDETVEPEQGNGEYLSSSTGNVVGRPTKSCHRGADVPGGSVVPYHFPAPTRCGPEPCDSSYVYLGAAFDAGEDHKVCVVRN